MGEQLVSCSGYIPDQISAGLTFNALLTLTAYPAPAWAVTFMLRGPAVIDLPATAEGSQHRLYADAATTAAWLPGAYRYVLRATDGTTTTDIDAGQTTILPDFATLPPGEQVGLTPAQIALAAIDAVLANRATLDQERYRINNRELYRTPIAELLKLRAFYAEQVKREQACGDSATGFGVTVRAWMR